MTYKVRALLEALRAKEYRKNNSSQILWYSQVDPVPETVPRANAFHDPIGAWRLSC